MSSKLRHRESLQTFTQTYIKQSMINHELFEVDCVFFKKELIDLKMFVSR